MFGKRKIAMIVAEFLGAAILAMAVYSMLARTSFPLFSGVAAGVTLAILVMVIGSVSGAHVNPAVTLGLWTIRKVSTSRAVVYIIAQMLGGLAAWGLIRYFLGHSINSIADSKFNWKIAVAEMVGTFIFTFGFAAAVYQKLDSDRKGLIIGGSFLLGILVASLASNGILNPAVALGIQSWSWTYAVSPLIGGVVGMNIYSLLFTDLPAEKVTNRTKGR